MEEVTTRGLNHDQKKIKPKSIHSIEERRGNGQQTKTENQLWKSHRVARIRILASCFGKKYCTFCHYHTGLDITGL